MWAWSAVVVTCRFSPDDLAAAYHDEFRLWQKKGVIDQGTEIIVVEDPGPELGSGGATLNAILVATEQLSSSKGFSVLVADVIRDARILIIHLGHQQHSGVTCGSAAFQRLPECTGWITPSQCRVPVTPLLHAYLTITLLAEQSERGDGVWICGSNSFLVLDHAQYMRQVKGAADIDTDILLFSIPVDPEYAAGKHGIYRLDRQRSVEEIVYRGTLDQMPACGISENDRRVPLALAMAHLKPAVAESLLHLQSNTPLNRCTYLGIDNGALSLKLSFFLDFLAATCLKSTEENFISGSVDGTSRRRGSLLGDQANTDDADAVIAAHRLVWRSLNRYKSRVDLLPFHYYYYFEDDQQDLKKFLSESTCVLRKFERHRYVTHPLHQNANEENHTLNGALVDDENYENSGERNTRTTDHVDGSVCAAFAQERQKYFQTCLHIIDDVLKNNRHVCLLPVFLNCVLDGFSRELLLHFDQIAIDCQSSSVIGRTLSCIADVLGYWAQGHGGLRTGPAQNAEWLHALNLLEAGNIQLGVERLAELRWRWSSRPDRLIRAARHYEAAAQIFIRRTVMDSVKCYIRRVRDSDETIPRRGKDVVVDEKVCYVATACARIDVAGGWSDTPPITYENGGAVLGIAIRIDGKKPIGAKCRRIREPTITVIAQHCGTVESRSILRTFEEIQCYKTPGSAATLVCASLVCAGVVDPNSQQVDQLTLEEQLLRDWGGGFEITYWSDLPHGSGLGASSILSGCVIATIWKAAGIDADVETILNSVLYVEQLMTTGGGWQDQVGGLCPGVKIGRFESDATWTQSCGRPRLTVQEVHLSEDRLRWLNSHLLVVYTGKTRLAKNLLQEVVRSWYARKQDIVNTVANLVRLAEKAATAFERGKWPAVSSCAREYWEQKKRMVGGSGCEPARVTALLKKLYEAQLIEAGWLAGAGGGGFLYLITKSPDSKAAVEIVLAEMAEPGAEMTAHSVTVDCLPFVVEQISADDL